MGERPWSGLETSLQAPDEKPRFSATPMPASSDMAIRSRPLRLATDNFKQSRAMCGPACLKIVFAYFGKQVSEKQIAKACRSTLRSGTTGPSLVRVAKQFGSDAKVIDRSNFRTIPKWLRRGVPVIVDWMSTVTYLGDRQPMACGLLHGMRAGQRSHCPAGPRHRRPSPHLA